MINKIYKSIIALLPLFFLFTITIFAQEKINITGVVVEASSNLPLESVLVSVANESASTNENGEFEINISDPNASLVVQIPGFTTRILKVKSKTTMKISMVRADIKSIDDEIPTPLGSSAVRDLTQPGSYLYGSDLNFKANTSIDQILQGKLVGTKINSSSGMPGSKSYMNIRGLSSLYGRNEPLVIIDEMIHPIHYANYSSIEGFTINPLDIVDVDDIESISSFNDGNSAFGSNGSNGIIYINLEQKRETSSSIVVDAYGGISFSPKRQSLLDAQGFKNLFNEELKQSGLSQDQINSKYSYLNATENSEEYLRYNNSTDWQDEIYKVGTVQKYHIFLKGGDNIATYNISTGYIKHDGIIENTSYNRFNLRVNGKINISDKFSITPNTKLSLSDSYLMEQGYNVSTNPIVAAQLKSPLMTPLKIDTDGKVLEFIDDLGAFNVSNPKAIVKNVEAYNRNYHLITSVKGQYVFNRNLTFSTFVGIDYNNARDNVFIPDIGLSRIDSAYNTSRSFVTEMRSTQNNNQLVYIKSFKNNSSINVKLGHRYVSNSFEYDMASDLNSPTDDFKSLGQGANNQELRTIDGENRTVKWVSYYATADYNIASKYYISGAFSYDANSALNKNSRYNFYPSISGAWRLSSEPFLSDKSWLDDLKIKASFSQSGNINNFAYDYSHLYYRGARENTYSVVVREAIPDYDMEMEKQTSINVGADLAMLSQSLNFSLNLFNSSVNNLLTRQNIAPAFGYTSYYTNAGSLRNMGAEFAFNYRKKVNSLIYSFGASLSYVDNKVTSLNFLLEDDNMIINQVEGVNLVTKAGGPMYSFYGLKTDGIFKDDAEAAKYIGPNGQKGKAGDVKYVDSDGNNVINDLDKTIIGSPITPMYGGINASVEYGNFEIKADMAFSAGNDIYNHVNKLGQSMELGHNQQTVIKDRWTANNNGSNIPNISAGDPYGSNFFSDRWLEKGAYARLNNFTVSYKYPRASSLFEDLTIYLTATNLFTITNYSGLDPESMLYNDPLYLSVDYGKIPQPKLVVIGIKLGL